MEHGEVKINVMIHLSRSLKQPYLNDIEISLNYFLFYDFDCFLNLRSPKV